jgi:hypothetical protein
VDESKPLAAGLTCVAASFLVDTSSSSSSSSASGAGDYTGQCILLAVGEATSAGTIILSSYTDEAGEAAG